MDDNEIDPVKHMFLVMSANNESIRIISELADRNTPMAVALAALSAATVMIARQAYEGLEDELEEGSGLEALLNEIRQMWMTAEQMNRNDNAWPMDQVGNA